MFRFLFLVGCVFLIAGTLQASDTLLFKLHFVYGSKPKHGYKAVEHKWFGGIHGGHVYMEVDHEIVSFGPNHGQWHVIAHKKNNVGKYRTDKDLVWHGDTGKLKLMTIEIPITTLQFEQFQSVKKTYFENSPYDYAFIGMRCAAGAYDMLCHAGVCQRVSRSKTVVTYFYPKKLRKRMLKRAKKEHWKVTLQEGRSSRKWERD